jgi:hypothetical protein
MTRREGVVVAILLIVGAACIVIGALIFLSKALTRDMDLSGLDPWIALAGMGIVGVATSLS